MEETYEAIIKLPIGKKPCTVAITRNGDGTFDGEFTVLNSTAPITNGKIARRGQLHGRVQDHHDPGNHGGRDGGPHLRRQDRRVRQVPPGRASAEVCGALVTARQA